MTAEEFLAHYKDHTNRFGLINPEGNESENDVRWTCEAELAAERNGLRMENYKFTDAISACVDYDILKINPENDNQNSMDNYIPFFYSMRGTLSSLRVCKRGVQNWWWYKNKNQDSNFWSPYMGRYAGFRAMAKMSAGLPLNWLDLNLYKIALHTAIKKTGDDQDGTCLTTFLFNMGVKSGYFDNNSAWFWIARNAWKVDFKKHWPHGYGEVLEKYHGHKTPNSELLWDYFGE